MKSVSFTALLLISVLVASPVSAAERASKVDYLALAALLIRDGDYEKAEQSLEKVDQSDESLDRKRYYTLLGLVHLKMSRFVQAKESLLLAIKAGQSDKVIHVYLAQAHFRLREYDACIEAIDEAGDAALDKPALWLMKATAYKELTKPGQSWQTLAAGREKFPDERRFLQLQVYLLLELGLYQKAVELGQEYLDAQQSQAIEHITLGNALLKSGQHDKALNVLERASLRFGADEKVWRSLAHAYLGAGRSSSAAAAMERAANIDSSFYIDAAELQRKAGNRNRALYLNSMAIDQKEKLRQRLGILIEGERYDEAVEMEDHLYRVGLLDDESVRYALAYAYFRIGIFLSAHDYLDGISSRKLFSKANQLRTHMENCNASYWECIN